MNTLKNKIITVFGGSGFIGSNLCDVLIKESPQKLIIVDNLYQSTTDNIKHLLDDKRVIFINGDVNDYNQIEPLVLNSDFIFNLAAVNVGNSIINLELDLETNIIGVVNILQAARKNKNVRIIHVSSGSVSNPSTPYAISKSTGEKYCQFFAKELDVDVSIIRYYHVYGPRQDIVGKCGVINIFLSRILSGLSPVIWGVGEQKKNFTFVLDSVNAAIIVAKNSNIAGSIYDVASDDRVSINELAHLLIKKYAKDKNMKPIYDKPKIGENMVLNPNTTKIKNLGWKINYTFSKGLDLSIKWVRDNLNNNNL